MVANNVCMGVNRAEASCCQPFEEDVPIPTPAGMVALIGMLCIAGAGRITKKRWEVMSRHYELCEHDHNML